MVIKEIDFKFSAGSNDKFLEFVKNISKKDRIAIISHNDLDGLTSGKVVYKFLIEVFGIKPNLVKFVGYEEVNDKLVEELKTTKINKIIFSDLAIDVVEIIRKISEFCDVLLIDHHLFNEDFNSDKITFIDIQGDCAAYICYRLFSQLDKDKDLEKIDWLIASACVADWQYFSNQEFMKKIYEKYGDSFEIIGDKTDFGGIRKSGLFWDLQWELSLSLIYFRSNLEQFFEHFNDKINDLEYLRKYSKIISKEIDKSIELFEKEKEPIGNCYIWEIKEEKYNIRSVVSNLVSAKYFTKTIIVIIKRGNRYSVSGRRQDRKVSIFELLKKCMEGLEESFSGGHIAAGGGYFLVKDLDKFKENLKKYSLF